MNDNIGWQIKIRQIDKLSISKNYCLVKSKCGHFDFIFVGDKKNTAYFKKCIKSWKSSDCKSCFQKVFHKCEIKRAFLLWLDKTEGMKLYEKTQDENYNIKYVFYSAKCERHDKTYH